MKFGTKRRQNQFICSGLLCCFDLCTVFSVPLISVILSQNITKAERVFQLLLSIELAGALDGELTKLICFEFVSVSVDTVVQRSKDANRTLHFSCRRRILYTGIDDVLWRVYHPAIFQVIEAHSACPPLWADAMNTGGGFGHRWGRNGEFCV